MKERLPFVIALVLIIGFSITGLLRLKFGTDILDVLPSNIPAVRTLKISQKQFNNDQQVALLLQSEGEEIYEEDVKEFVEKLREKLSPATVLYKSELEEDPRSFGVALAEIWRYAPPEAIAELEGRLTDKESLAAHLEEVKSLIRTSFDQQKATVAAYDPLGFLDHPAMRQFMDSELSFQSDNGKSWIVLIENPEPTMDYHKHEAWLGKIRKAANSWSGLDELTLKYGLTGGPVFNAEIGAGMEKDMSGTVTITSILVAVLFLIVQRNPGQMVMISLLVGLSFVITLGMGGWIFGTLNLVSVGFAAILLGLIIDYAVVIARESMGGFSSSAVLRRELAPGILWAAATTAIVFGLLTLSTFNGVRQLGGLIVIGLASGAAVMLVFTPMFLRRFPTGEPKRLLKAPFASRIVARAVIAVCILIPTVIFLTKGEPDISFNFSMVQPSTSEAAATFSKIQEKFPAWSDKNLQIIAESDSWEGLRAAAITAGNRLERLQDDGTIEQYQWPVDLIPNHTFSERNKDAIARIASEKEDIIRDVESAGFSKSGIELDRLVLDALATPQSSPEPGKLAKNFLSSSPRGKKYMSGGLLATEEVTEENIQSLKSLESEDFNVTSWAVIQAALLPSVRNDFYMIFIPATAVLLLALLAVFRSVRDAAICISVLLTVLALVNAYVVVTGHAWNFLSGMAIPLIVGSGIDYSIHLVFALRRNDGDFEKVWNGVGKAICFCGISTAIGFGSLLFASNEMLRSMGTLCSLGVLLTTALSVFVVPGLWKRLGH